MKLARSSLPPFVALILAPFSLSIISLGGAGMNWPLSCLTVPGNGSGVDGCFRINLRRRGPKTERRSIESRRSLAKAAERRSIRRSISSPGPLLTAVCVCFRLFDAAWDWNRGPQERFPGRHRRVNNVVYFAETPAGAGSVWLPGYWNAKLTASIRIQVFTDDP